MAEAAGHDDVVELLQREVAKREKAKAKAVSAKAAASAKRTLEDIAEELATNTAIGPERKKKKKIKKEITLSHLEADE